MQIAAYDAGVAFKSLCWLCSRLKPSTSGTYGTAHGLANAVILPIMLRKYGSKLIKTCRTSLFTQIVNENTPIEEAANAFREHAKYK